MIIDIAHRFPHKVQLPSWAPLCKIALNHSTRSGNKGNIRAIDSHELKTVMAKEDSNEKEFASFLQTNVEGLSAERAKMVAPLLIQGGFETKEDLLHFADFETLKLCKILPAHIAMILNWAKVQQEKPNGGGKRKAMDADQNIARENKRSRRSLESYFGTHTVVMKVDDLLKYIQGCQEQHKMRQNDVIHNEAELSLKLQGREEAMDTTVEAFRKRKDSFISGADDRTLYPIVVYSGMAGVGKTRMLEEWKQHSKSLESLRILTVY